MITLRRSRILDLETATRNRQSLPQQRQMFRDAGRQTGPVCFINESLGARESMTDRPRVHAGLTDDIRMLAITTVIMSERITVRIFQQRA